jgi:hypothetical protein
MRVPFQVVPAKAGTYNHRHPLLRRAAAPALVNTQASGYGSRLALPLQGGGRQRKTFRLDQFKQAVEAAASMQGLVLTAVIP